MKRPFLLVAVLLLFASCNDTLNVKYSEQGYLKIKTSKQTLIETRFDYSLEIPDVEISNYQVYIYNSLGEILPGYPKKYGELSEKISLSEDEYIVKVQSVLDDEINLPSRDKATVWYLNGSAKVDIKSGSTTQADITATVATSVISLKVSDKFVEKYPDYSFNVKGIIFNSQNMQNVYIEGGDELHIELTYTENGEKLLKTYKTKESVKRGSVITLNFKYNGEAEVDYGDGTINIDINKDLTDSEYTWSIEDGEDGIIDGELNNPLTVEAARERQNLEYLWVEGYIVGYIKSSTTVITDYIEAKDSNIAIASKAGETNIEKMLFVELSGSNTAARKALGINITEGKSIGYKVKMRGVLESYFNTPGLKGINTEDKFVIVSSTLE